MNNSDSLYIKMLEDSIKKIDTDISELEKKANKKAHFNDRIYSTIEGLKVQKKLIQEEIDRFYTHYNDSRYDDVIAISDNISQHNSNKKAAIQEEIKNLKALRESLVHNSSKRQIDRRIERKERKLKRLENRTCHINKAQRVIMYPKYRKEKKKLEILSKEQGKVNNIENRLQDIETIRNSLDVENSLKDRITDKIYQLKENRYKKKFDHHFEVLNTMKNSKSNIAMRGANAIVLSKGIANKIRKTNMDNIFTDTNNLDVALDTGLSR